MANFNFVWMLQQIITLIKLVFFWYHHIEIYIYLCVIFTFRECYREILLWGFNKQWVQAFIMHLCFHITIPIIQSVMFDFNMEYVVMQLIIFAVGNDV